MAKNFRVLEARMSPEARARSEAKAKELIAGMALDELRQAMDLTQEQIADTLRVQQAAVSKLERRSDMYISTLRKFIRAMGGDLEIRAIFPTGSVLINQFREVRKRRAS